MRAGPARFVHLWSALKPCCDPWGQMPTAPEIVLSPEQQRAVDSPDAAILVVASAGSGKTEVVARRVERLLRESDGESFRILALSYTLKAADELETRFRSRLGDLARRVDTNTVHGFAHSLLCQHGTRIGLPVEPEVLTRDEDRAELLARWLADEGHPVPEDLTAVLRELDLARARLRSAPLLDEWEAALTASGALDYPSMLTRATELLGLASAQRQLARLYKHVIVDEAQNLTPAQYALLVTLVGGSSAGELGPSTMVVGDEKQSIVSFAGADPTLMSRYAEEFTATRVELRQNFRSAEAIVTVGTAVAAELGQAGNGSPDTSYAAPGLIEAHEAPDELSEGRFVAAWAVDLIESGIPEKALADGERSEVRPDEIAVLARSSASLQTCQAELLALGTQVAMASAPEDWLATTGGKVAFEVIALRSANSHRSTHWQLARLLGVDEADVQTPADLTRVLHDHPDARIRLLAPLTHSDDPAGYIAALEGLEPEVDSDDLWLPAWEADVSQILATWKAFLHRTSHSEQTWGGFRLFVSRQQRGDDLDPGVRLLTIHKAQGREYRAVALVGLNDGQIPDFRAKTADELQSELRAFYVAVSRPSRVLLVTRARSRQTRYGSRNTEPSPYWEYLNHHR